MNVAASMKDKNVEVFWVEKGSNTQCERALALDYRTNSVIAFSTNKSTFVQMQQAFSEAAVGRFVEIVQQYGTDLGAAKPAGGIKLVDEF